MNETDQELQALIMGEFELDEQLFAFAKVHDKLSDEGYWTILGRLYRACEHPWMINSFIGSLFNMERPGKTEFLMNQAEWEAWGRLRNVVTVYRGCWSANDTGWNYCLTRPEAVAFAREFPLDGQPVLIRAKVHRNNIQSLFLLEKGPCVVVDPRLIAVREVRKLRFSKKAEEARVSARLINGVNALDPNWQRLQFLLPVVHTLVALRKAPEEQRDAALTRLLFEFGRRVGLLDKWGFKEMAEKVFNQSRLIGAPTQEVLDWVKHFEVAQEVIEA